MTKEKVAVIGAGIMGCDIALDLASYGYSVVLKNIDSEALEKAEKKIHEKLKFFKMIKSRFSKYNPKDLLVKIVFDLDYDNFRNINFIIENIKEDYAFKESLYLELRDIYVWNNQCYHFI